MKFNRLPFLTCAAWLAFAACEQQAGDDAAAGDTLGDTVAADTTTRMPTEPVVTELDEVNDSDVSGEATATHAQDQVTVSILLKEGAQAGTEYAAHIHTGNCKDGGPVAVALESVRNLQSQKTIAASAIPADRPAFIQVHGANGQPVACGDMKGHEGHDGAAGPDTMRSPTRY